MSDKPTVGDLDTCLRGVVESWKRFAHHLPGIDQTELDIIEENKPGNVVGKKLELYKAWLRVYPNASWNDVIKGLEMIGENTIAEQLREKYITKKVQLVEVFSSSPSSDAVPRLPMPPNQISATTSEEVTIREEVVTELNTLHQSFLGLACDVKTEVRFGEEKGSIDIKSITLKLQEERAYSIPSLRSVTTSNELFEAIHPHYNFLNSYLIVSIALYLSGAIAEKATEYKENVRKFMKTTKIRSLQNTLKRYSRMFRDRSNTAVVEIVVENGWEAQDLWLVRNLVTTLFPVKHPDELPWYDIVPGSVVITFIALEHMTSSFIESSGKKTEFMRLIGVISLKIGDELAWKKMDKQNKYPFSFEDSLIQAALADNIETVQFLLQCTQVNVNTKNTTNTLIDAGDEEIYWSQETIGNIIESNHTIFTAVLEDVEYEFQYVQGQSTEVDHHSNSSSPVADTSKSAHCPRDNFLNGGILAGLSDQLPEHLSTRVKQYQAEVNGSTKRKLLLSDCSWVFEKYFPTPFPDSIEVILALHSVWLACSIWYVEQLGQLIFTPTLFHKLQWFRVDTSEESLLRVVLLADKESMDSLTKECLGNDESLTSLLGVISVRVDDIVVISNDYSNGYTFNEAFKLAKAMGNDKISDLLLQIQQSPVDFIRHREPDNNNNCRFLPEPDSTPLMIACCNDNSQLVQLLLEHNADPNIQSRHGYTALMYSTGNSKIFQMLLDRGADVETCSFLNESVLYYACWLGNVKVVKAILAKSHNLVNITTNIGHTPLQEACHYVHMTATVEMLLKAKADPNIQDNKGQTALLLAIQYANSAIVQMLLQAEADPNIQDNKGQTALLLAIHYGYTEIVRMLLQAKADPNIQDDKGDTPLLNASLCGFSEIVGMLLQAKADVNFQGSEGETALHLASSKGHTELVKMLLQAKADLNVRQGKGWTPLDRASRFGRTEIVRMLLQAKANPDYQDKKGVTALHQASRFGHTEAVRILLQGNANPHMVNNDGLTALDLAFKYNRNDIIKELRSVTITK